MSTPIKLIEREVSVLDHSADLETLHTLPGFPVFMGCVDHPASEDLLADQTWDICRNTGILQLKHLIPLDVLYQAQHAGAVGEIWMKHHRQFARFLHNVGPSSVVELGGAHGILSVEYGKLREVPWTILEPNPAPVEGCKARFIRGFFDGRFKYEAAFDTVVHSHVFEHIYEPDVFMGQLARFMKRGNQLVFALPNMQAMLEHKYTNCINFEHTVFLTEPYIEFLLAKHGFRLVHKQYFMDDHSIFYATVRDPDVRATVLPAGLYDKNRKLYLDYVDYHVKLIEDLNRKIRAAERKVYLFGAHVFAQYLIEFGLDTSCITCVLDNDPKKQGRRLYGTSLKVNSPKILREIDNPLVILKAGVYNNEIRNDILQNINPAATFLE